MDLELQARPLLTGRLVNGLSRYVSDASRISRSRHHTMLTHDQTAVPCIDLFFIAVINPGRNSIIYSTKAVSNNKTASLHEACLINKLKSRISIGTRPSPTFSPPRPHHASHSNCGLRSDNVAFHDRGCVQLQLRKQHRPQILDHLISHCFFYCLLKMTFRVLFSNVSRLELIG